MEKQSESSTMRGGEWCFKISGSRKIFAEIHGSRSLVYFSGYTRLEVSIFFTNLSNRIDFFRGQESHEVPILYLIYELE